MSYRRYASCLLLALVATRADAASSVFWPFGFYFPDKAHHHSGGYSAAARPTRVALRDVADRRTWPAEQTAAAAQRNASDEQEPALPTMP